MSKHNPKTQKYLQEKIKRLSDVIRMMEKEKQELIKMFQEVTYER